MLRAMIQLIRTAAAVRELLAVGMFREVRVSVGTRGLESRLFVEYCGVQSIVGLNGARGLARAKKKMIAEDVREWEADWGGNH